MAVKTTSTDFTFTSAPVQARKPHNFLRFLGYVAPYKWWVVLSAIGGVMKFGVPLLVPQVTRHLIDNVYQNDLKSVEQKTQEMLFFVLGMIAMFVFIWAPWTYVRHYFSGRAGYKSVFDLRVSLYYRILRMSASYFDRNKSGTIVTRLINDVETAQNLVGNALTSVWMDIAALFITLFFLTQINNIITLAALVTFPFYIYFFRRVQRRIKESSRQLQEERAAMSGSVQEKIAGSRVVHAFAQEKSEQVIFHAESMRLFNKEIRNVHLQSMNITISGIMTQVAPLIVMLVGGLMVIHELLTVGELVAVTMYLAPLYTPLERFADLNVVFANATAALDRIFELLDAEPEIRDLPMAVEMENVDGRVRFEHVTFTYGNNERGVPIIRDVNFTVEPGQHVALVGPSGSGKSTIMSLIPRFYDIESGHIYIDNYDIRDVKVGSLRENVGLVLQTPILFSGTVRDNILYGKPNATEDELTAACKAANAYDFIMGLPRGFDTEVGESGVFLSGGQRQRLTIARAFLKDPKILILDEATSALDSESERLIQSALERLMEGRTTFIIAHRLSTIINADCILVLRQGEVVERGTHDELLAQNGVYTQLYGNIETVS